MLHTIHSLLECPLMFVFEFFYWVCSGGVTILVEINELLVDGCGMGCSKNNLECQKGVICVVVVVCIGGGGRVY